MNRYLLDTHVLLWWQDGGEKLSDEACDIIRSPRNIIFVSAVSVWEIAIKTALDKLNLPSDWQSILAAEPFEHLSITFPHAFELSKLPPIHRDPFDRMLVAQARVESLRLITHDDIVCNYDINFVQT